MKIDPNAPTYPCNESLTFQSQGMLQNQGIPIRLEIAARMMATIIVDPLNKSLDYEIDALNALRATDALIAAYNGSEP